MTNEFMDDYRRMCRRMLDAPVIHTGSWQSTDTSASPVHATHEIVDEMYSTMIPWTLAELQFQMPVVNLPWAELHFQERVGGKPLNPPPSHTQWPWARHNARFQDGEQGPFSHSYPERLWSRYSGFIPPSGVNFIREDGETYRANPFDGTRIGDPIDMSEWPRRNRKGVRFRYGDLNDLVDLLIREPLTRQAYLPIWFPEDTGNHAGVRVPCTLGYHLMIRDGELSCRYYMRSCDIIRHFPDDVYMAARLTQWIAHQYNQRMDVNVSGAGVPYPPDTEPIKPGLLLMYISSFHAFVGDEYILRQLSHNDPVHNRLGGSSQPS